MTSIIAKVALILALVGLGLAASALTRSNNGLNVVSNQLKTNCTITNNSFSSVGFGVTFTAKTTGRVMIQASALVTSTVAGSTDFVFIFRNVGPIAACNSPPGQNIIKAEVKVVSVLDTDGLTVGTSSATLNGYDNTTIGNPIVKGVTYSYFLGGQTDGIALDSLIFQAGLATFIRVTET